MTFDADTGQHLYISTACQHSLHPECRLECKWCDARCLCECHWGG